MKQNASRKRYLKILQNIAIISFCILLNLGGRHFTNVFELPFWLDTVGTCVAAHFTGLVGALLAGTAPIFVFGMANNTIFQYLIVAIVLAVAICLFAQRDYLAHLDPAMMCSFAAGLLAIAVSTPLNLLLRGGYTGNIWGDALFDMMSFRGLPKALCALSAESIVNIVDKQISFFLAFLIIRCIKVLSRQSDKRQKIKRSISLLLAVSMVTATAAFVTAPAVYASPKMEDPVGRMKTIYGSDAGLNVTGLNAVVQTPDGYIWVGGYGGLYRYDGIEFKKMNKDGAVNITDLLVDKNGRLWAATTDSGIIVYEDMKETVLSQSAGLPNQSVHTLFQASDGIVYAGMTGTICTISESLHVKNLQNNMPHVVQFAQNSSGLLACVDDDGSLSIMEDNWVVAKITPQNGEKYTCVMGDGDGFWLGTSGSVLNRIVYTDGKIEIEKEITLEVLQNISCLKRGISGLIWVGAYNGVGTLNQEDELKIQRHEDFRNSIEDITQDYEGNMWLVSSHYGLMKLSASPFTDIYAYKNLQKKTANAVLVQDNILYSATDEGLDVIDLKTGEQVQNKLTRALENQRVRCIQSDGQGGLWACTYGSGVFYCSKNGRVTNYTAEKNGIADDFVRCMTLLEDGTAVTGGSEGITFFKGGKVVKVLHKSEELSKAQVLCLTAMPDGTLYAGSDGAGIYVIQNGEITGKITEKDGLSSSIIIRITPYRDGFFAVTSNALNYWNGKQAVELEKFPCYQNYDVLISGEDAWVLSSCGIYKTKAEELAQAKDTAPNCILYDSANGLQGSVTALSWSWIDENCDLLFCTNEGVQKINARHQKEFSGPYKMKIVSFQADGKTISPTDGRYMLSSDAMQIEVKAAVLSYSMENLKVRFYMEGLDTQTEIVDHTKLKPLHYTKIPHGNYKVQLQILNEEGQILQAQSFPVIKQAQMWEETYYEIYLVIVIAWMTAYATWVIINLTQFSKRKKQLEIMSRRLEEKVQEQTAEIREQSRKITAMQWNLIEGMASLIESRDGTTGAHVLNTGNYVGMIANQMLKDQMYPDVVDKRFVQTVTEVAPLHDVGKIKVSDLILNKPGPLTDEEYEIMKNHAKEGGAVIRDILGEEADPYLRGLAEDIATYHHERWDGKGYPYGLQGTQIPLCARIMAVADVFDALVSKRSYKSAMTLDEVYAAIENGKGTQFQKEIVDEFVKVRPQVEAYLKKKK